MEISENPQLLDRCQRRLVQAWIARIRATEAGVGDRFGFVIAQREPTTFLFADCWPQNPGQIPFDRVFNYVAPVSEDRDPILQQVVEAKRDVVIEVLPGPQRAHSEAVLRAYGYTPRWQIPWLQIDLARRVPALPASHSIQPVAADAWPSFGALYVAAYGYTGAAAAAWQTLAEHGYRGNDFHCFVAAVDQTAAAFGVMFCQGPIALVDGAATLPQQRGLGLQKSLLDARLHAAQARGCTHAFSRTGLGSISQHNLEQLGLHTFVQSTAWRRDETVARG